jgi:hypothetical protein
MFEKAATDRTKRGVFMNAVPIIQRERFYREREPGNYCGSALPESSLPHSYMSDYSILGPVVDDLPLTLRTLERGAITLGYGIPDLESFTIDSRNLRRAVQLLNAVGIGFDLTDIVYGIYQG